MAYCGGVVKNGVTTIGVGFPNSCPLASLVLSAQQIILWRRPFPNLSNGIICSKYGDFWRRRGDMQRDGTLSRANHKITFPARFQLIAAMNPTPTGHYQGQYNRSNPRLASSFHVLFDGIPTFICAKYAVLCRRRFINVVFNVIPRLVPKYGVFWRRLDEWRPDTRCFLSQSLHIASRGFYWLHFRFGIGAATLVVCFPASYQTSSRGSSTLNWRLFAASRRLTSVCQHRALRHPEAVLGLTWNPESSHARRRSSGVVSDRIFGLVYMVSNVGVGTIGVATLLIGLPASCHIASRGFSWLSLVF
jgi:hypothetical protein